MPIHRRVWDSRAFALDPRIGGDEPFVQRELRWRDLALFLWTHVSPSMGPSAVSKGGKACVRRTICAVSQRSIDAVLAEAQARLHRLTAQEAAAAVHDGAVLID